MWTCNLYMLVAEFNPNLVIPHIVMCNSKHLESLLWPRSSNAVTVEEHRLRSSVIQDETGRKALILVFRTRQLEFRRVERARLHPLFCNAVDGDCRTTYSGIIRVGRQAVGQENAFAQRSTLTMPNRRKHVASSRARGVVDNCIRRRRTTFISLFSPSAGHGRCSRINS